MEYSQVIKLFGLLASVFGVAGFAYQLWRKSKELSELKEKKEEVEKEKEKIISEKEEYRETIEETKEVISDLQDAVVREGMENHGMNDMLNRLEDAILPYEERILSKISRLQTSIVHDEEEEYDVC